MLSASFRVLVLGLISMGSKADIIQTSGWEKRKEGGGQWVPGRKSLDFLTCWWTLNDFFMEEVGGYHKVLGRI